MQKKSPFIATGYASRGAAARSFGREPRWTSQKKALRFPPVSWLGPRRTDACWIWRIAGLTYGFPPARLARIKDPGKELRSAGDVAPRPKQTGRYGCIHRPRASHDRM